MIEIRNKTTTPVQLVVRSFSKRREHAKALTVKNIPGNTTIKLPDERVVMEYLDRHKKWGLLSYNIIPDNAVHKGEI